MKALPRKKQKLDSADLISKTLLMKSRSKSTKLHPHFQFAVGRSLFPTRTTSLSTPGLVTHHKSPIHVITRASEIPGSNISEPPLKIEQSLKHGVSFNDTRLDESGTSTVYDPLSPVPIKSPTVVLVDILRTPIPVDLEKNEQSEERIDRNTLLAADRNINDDFISRYWK